MDSVLPSALWWHVRRIAVPDSNGIRAHSMRIHILSIRLLIHSFQLFCGDMFQGLVHSIGIPLESTHILLEYWLSPSMCFYTDSNWCFKGCGARFKWQQGAFYDPFHKNSYTFYKNTYSFLTFVVWCHVSRVVPWQVPRVVPFYKWIHTLSIRILT